MKSIQFTYHLRTLVLVILCFAGVLSHAQIEDLIVETYYISAKTDTMDGFDAFLKEGSVTYRVYLDLAEGTRLMGLFGDDTYPFKIRSTGPVFNHPLAYSTFGYAHKSSFLTGFASSLPVDSWLTLGFASDRHMGIPKSSDPDSTLLHPGFLTNVSEEAGLPLHIADGLVEADSMAASYRLSDIEPEHSIFVNLTGDSVFTGYSSLLETPFGVEGPTGENLVLVAQITTKGEIELSINVKLKMDGEVRKYVGKDTTEYRDDVAYSNYLAYPKKSGCTDPHYAEFDPTAVIDDGSCITPIVLGCMDPSACNYDPDANFNVPELCCYPPDSCDNRDIAKICPDWQSMQHSSGSVPFDIYPNPVSSHTCLDIAESKQEKIRCRVVDLYGTVLFGKTIEHYGGMQPELDLSHLNPGSYLLQVFTGDGMGSLFFIKE